MTTQSIRRDFTETDFETAKSLITWNALVEPGDRIASQLIGEVGPIDALRALRSKAKLGEDYERAYERWAPRDLPLLAETKIALAKKHDLKLLLPSDETWPQGFRDLGLHSPLLLWYRGNSKHFEWLNKAIGVVGSRNASHYGQRITADLVEVLAQEEAVVVSGGALGIDSVAHRVAIGLKGRTIAFMAGSLDLPYPAANLNLFNEISHHGLLLSEMSPGSNPTRWRFLQRNRLIAASANAVVVTEAGLRSGSINTVNHAGELGRPVFAIPGPITSPSSAGCNRLIRDLQVQLLMDVGDLPAELGWRETKLNPQNSIGVLELRALDALGKAGKSFAELRHATGMSETELRIALGGLKLVGLCALSESGSWQRN